MHEMSIAEGLIDHVLRTAREAGAVRVEEVVVECGALRGVVPEALQAAFDALAEGTEAQGAAVAVTETPITARCRACNAEFAPTTENFVCPACGRADVEILSGNHILLTSVVCVTESETEGENA